MRLFSRNREPRRIGAFEIVEKIGQGGMCTVYLGHQASLDRPVAVKVLNEKLGKDPEARDRFERESRIIAHLSHPNIVHVLDRGITSDGAPYFVMEYIEGIDLHRAMEGGALDLNRKVEISIQLCRALAYAHRNGVVHRDIKPGNIAIDPEGNAILLDFGIAKLVDRVASEEGDPPERTIAGTRDETRAELVLGTLAYMAPEQMYGGHPITAATDMFSLGVVLYEMFTGRRPEGRFAAPSEVDPELPAELDAVILRCLERDPADRFASADPVRDRLLELLRGAHLDTDQRERAAGGLERLRATFTLLDVIRESANDGVYLYQHRIRRTLFVIRKRIDHAGGLAEARLLAALRHPGLAEVHGVSGDERRFIVVMEYLTGGSLAERLAEPWPADAVLRLGSESAEALAFAHRNRIVHGAMRPSSSLFDESGAVKIGGFGFEGHPVTGRNVYNPFHEPRSAAADVLALGVILFQCATGILPSYRNGSLVLEPQLLRLPESLRSILAEMLAPDRGTRLSSAEAAAFRFRDAIDLAESRARRPLARVAGS